MRPKKHSPPPFKKKKRQTKKNATLVWQSAIIDRCVLVELVLDARNIKYALITIEEPSMVP